MKFETFPSELFRRFPQLEAQYIAEYTFMLHEPPLPYCVFPRILRGALETALDTGNSTQAQALCDFIEEMAQSAGQDYDLQDLLKIEFGKWLSFTERENAVAPFLGTETKRVCGYVPGLATQRIEMKSRTLRSKIARRLHLRPR